MLQCKCVLKSIQFIYGGEMMAQEMIQTIRQAELDAAKSIKDAQQESELMIKNARDQADLIVTNMINEMQIKADQLIAEANGRNESFLESAVQKAKEEISFLEKNVMSKKSEVIKLVVAEII